MSEGAEHDKSHKPDGDKPEVGTSLAPAVEAAGGVDPFLAKASEAPEAAAARPLYAKALDYSAHAAMIVGLVGFAWTVSEHVVRRQPSTSAARPAKVADAATATPVAAKSSVKSATATPAEATKPDEIGDLRKANQKMAAEIRNLHASLEALRTTVVRERGAGEDVRSLSAGLESMRSSLAGLKSEQAAALAQLSGKVEKLRRDERAQAAADGVPPRSERQAIDTTATASIPSSAAPKPAAAEPAKAVPTPPSKPTVLASAEPPGRSEMSRSEVGKSEMGKSEMGKSGMGKSEEEAGKTDETKPPVIQGWVVRDVYEGVALIEGRRGQMEVVPGVSIPGAGVVRSIERHGSGWTVTTTKGQLAYAAPMRDYRRGPMRDYYGSRRYDF